MSNSDGVGKLLQGHSRQGERGHGSCRDYRDIRTAQGHPPQGDRPDINDPNEHHHMDSVVIRSGQCSWLRH